MAAVQYIVPIQYVLTYLQRAALLECVCFNEKALKLRDQLDGWTDELTDRQT